MTRPLPHDAESLIKSFESLRLTGYLCPAGVPTIGFGSTGPDVHVGMKITTRQAQVLFEFDCRQAAQKLEAAIGEAALLKLNDNQYGALLSFVFNLGADPKWTIWKLVKAGDYDGVPAQLRRFVNAGGRKLAGLVRRREAEAALWDQPVGRAQPPVDDAPSSGALRQMDTPPAPAPNAKPLVQSKTIWAGAATSAGGLLTAMKDQVQPVIVAQAGHSAIVDHMGSIVAVAIVGLGVLVVLFRSMDEKAKRQ